MPYEQTIPIRMTRLVPLCPGIPAAFYQPYPVWHDTIASEAFCLLQEHPAVTVSGRSRSSWEDNARIGKTTAVRTSLIPKLLQQDRKVSYLNIQRLIYQKDEYGRPLLQFDALLTAISRLDSDVLVLDEIHHSFPLPSLLESEHLCGPGKQGGSVYRTALVQFWGSVDAHLEAGGKAVFVTALHPVYLAESDPNARNMLVSPAMLAFFTAPVLELASWREAAHEVA